MKVLKENNAAREPGSEAFTLALTPFLLEV
jgi:hypothetical protein